jgi:hypothetical protein
MTMSQYKLTYFNLRARGELARLLFAAAGVEYEDIRLEKAQWLELKPSKHRSLEFDKIQAIYSSTPCTNRDYFSRESMLLRRARLTTVRCPVISACM